MVQEGVPPFVIRTFKQFAWLAMYPLGAVSVAVQVAPMVKPVIVVENGVASEALPLAGEGVPLEQVTLTGTVAPSSGTKSLMTVKVALFSVFVIVHEEAPPLLMLTLAQAATLDV
jgi:hypothetical protein